MSLRYFNYRNFSQEILDYFCNFSKELREKIFDEIYTLTIYLSDKLDKNWSKIMAEGENLELGNLLKETWLACKLLYQIESFVLPYLFLRNDFDNTYKEKFEIIKQYIVGETYLTKKMLEYFIKNRKLIAFTNSAMPNWETQHKKFNFTSNIIEFISLETTNTMIIEVQYWVRRDSLFCFNNLKNIIWKEFTYVAQLDYTWFFFVLKRRQDLFENYKDNMIKFGIEYDEIF